MPLPCNHENQTNFVEDVRLLSNQINTPNNRIPFLKDFRNHHPIHWCRRAGTIMSDDINLYIRYYDQVNENNDVAQILNIVNNFLKYIHPF